eukprot:g12151.t1
MSSSKQWSLSQEQFRPHFLGKPLLPENIISRRAADRPRRIRESPGLQNKGQNDDNDCKKTNKFPLLGRTALPLPRLGPSGGGGSRSLGNNVSASTCPERVLFEVVARRCEMHRREAQRLRWSDSLQAISEAVTQDLQTWATRHRLDPSDSGGSSRRLATLQQRAAGTLASIQELDQVIAKLRLVPLHRLSTGDQGLVAAGLPGEALPLFWSALPFVVRSALLRMSTVCGIGSLLYVLNIHRLAICVRSVSCFNAEI